MFRNDESSIRQHRYACRAAFIIQERNLGSFIVGGSTMISAEIAHN
jgi:hypothetical protein